MGSTRLLKVLRLASVVALLGAASCSHGGRGARSTTSGSTRPAIRWTTWVSAYCEGVSVAAGAINGRTVLFEDVPVDVHDAASARLVKAKVMSVLRGIVAATDKAARTAEGAGQPTVPNIVNGEEMVAAYVSAATANASFFADLQADGARLPTDDAASFLRGLASLRADAKHWADIGNDYFGRAQTLDTSHKLEAALRADSDCFWLGD